MKKKQRGFLYPIRFMIIKSMPYVYGAAAQNCPLKTFTLPERPIPPIHGPRSPTFKPLAASLLPWVNPGDSLMRHYLQLMLSNSGYLQPIPSTQAIHKSFPTFTRKSKGAPKRTSKNTHVYIPSDVQTYIHYMRTYARQGALSYSRRNSLLWAPCLRPTVPG